MKKTFEQLCAIRDEQAKEIAVRTAAQEIGEKHILICGGTGCTSSGSTKIREALEAEV